MATAVSSPIRATTAALTGALHPIANEPEHCEQSTPLVLVHHSLITADSDALQFHAAASLQLQPNRKHASNAKTDDKLISSPYNDYFHLLDLKSLDTPSQLLAKALTIFKPICTNYATAPYIESFNWEAIFAFLRELSTTEGFPWPTKQSFYVVVFRSILSVDANKDRLSELDYHSHREATSSGGLLKYWFGSTNENRENLATCKLGKN